MAGFVDFGEVTRGPFSPGDIPGMLWAVGVGLRYLTPIGPIRVDIARRLPFGTLPVLYTVDMAPASSRRSAILPPETASASAARGNRPPSPTGAACCTSRSARRSDADPAHGRLVVVGVVALLVGGTWVFLQTRWGGETVRRLALPRLNAAIAGRIAAERFRFGGDRLVLEGAAVHDPRAPRS